MSENSGQKLLSSGHSYRLVMEWDRPDVQGFFWIYEPDSISTPVGWEYGGFLTHTLTDAPFPATFGSNHRLNMVWGDESNVTVRAYWDGHLMNVVDAHLVGQSSSYAYFNFGCAITEDENFIDVVLTPSELSPGDTANVVLKKGTLDSLTSLVNFPSGQQFDVEFALGAINGTLLSPNGVDTSDNLTGVLEGFKFIAADSISADSVLSVIKVTTNITGQGDIYGYGEVDVIKKYGLHHFALTILPDTFSVADTIAYAEKAKLIVQAKDFNDRDIEIPADTLLNFAVLTNDEYGTFIDESGDTLTGTPVVLQNIAYSDANNGNIYFAAVKDNPASTVSCNLRVELDSDTTKSVEKPIIVLRQSLEIVIDTPYTVKPIITGRKRDNVGAATYVTNTKPENLKIFKVVLNRDQIKLPDHVFRISTDYIDSSGGHHHVGGSYQRRPKSSNRLMYTNYGRIRSLQNENVANPLVDTTIVIDNHPDSLASFQFKATIWGDEIIIYVKSIDNELLKDSVVIVERIPELIEMQPGNNYVLIGGPDNHMGTNDPCRDSTSLSSWHFDNHYGTQDLINTIVEIADTFATDNPGMKIRVNDMSLQYGGKFDIYNNWTSSHAEHRIGKDVDLTHIFLDSNNVCTYPDSLLLEEYHNTITNIVGAEPTPEGDPVYPEGNHYHLRIY